MVQTAQKYKSDVSAMAGISRPHRLGMLDGRTKEARRLREITVDLIDHCGGAGRVSAAQRYLIERTATDLVRLELLDIKSATGTLTEHDGRIAHALRSSVRLALRQLGMQPVAPTEKPMTAVEYGKLLDARKAEAAA
jgi:hypothetical protein